MILNNRADWRNGGYLKPSEASKIFNKWMNCKDAYQADPQCDGKCLSCEYYTASDEDEKEAMQMAISALKKQEPMKPLQQEMDIDGRAITPCGFCGEELPRNILYNFCPYCGQAIDRRKE